MAAGLVVRVALTLTLAPTLALTFTKPSPPPLTAHRSPLTLTLTLPPPWLQVSSSAFSRSIARWEEDVECSHQFMELVRRELLGTRVFVFTEHGATTRI